MSHQQTPPTDHQTERFLDGVVRSRTLEAMWLNTLSLLEHIGASKIRRAVGDRHDRTDVLDHAADEARHAVVLKRQAESIEKVEAYLAKEAATTYFSRLDHEANGWLDDELGGASVWRAYLVTTALIEQRALRLYPAYQERTEHRTLKRELQRLIGEETKHRLMIEDAAKALVSSLPEAWEKLLAMEEALFTDFIRAASEAANIPVEGERIA